MACQRFMRSDDNFASRRIDMNDISWLTHGDSQSLSLADRKSFNSFVSAYRMTIDGNNISVPLLSLLLIGLKLLRDELGMLTG